MFHFLCEPFLIFWIMIAIVLLCLPAWNLQVRGASFSKLLALSCVFISSVILSFEPVFKHGSAKHVCVYLSIASMSILVQVSSEVWQALQSTTPVKEMTVCYGYQFLSTGLGLTWELTKCFFIHCVSHISSIMVCVSSYRAFVYITQGMLICSRV